MPQSGRSFRGVVCFLGLLLAPLFLPPVVSTVNVTCTGCWVPATARARCCGQTAPRRIKWKKVELANSFWPRKSSAFSITKRSSKRMWNSLTSDSRRTGNCRVPWSPVHTTGGAAPSGSRALSSSTTASSSCWLQPPAADELDVHPRRW